MNLVKILRDMWGTRAPLVAEEYHTIVAHNELFVADIAIFCNAAAPIRGDNEFDRGVEEGKRRVWLHIARMASINSSDFVPITNGDRVFSTNQ